MTKKWKEHLFIPDCQVKPGVPTEHLEALGNYIVDKKPDTIICIGDFADMPSLSQYETPGSKKAEGQRYSDDIEASHAAMERLLGPMADYNYRQRRNKEKQYKPRMVMTLGNHEDRIDRAIKANPRHFDGVISTEDLCYKEYGWEVHPFLEIVEIDQIHYSHYFCNPESLTKNVLGGTINNKLGKLGVSFSMGHQQNLQFGVKPLATGKSLYGLVHGSFYMHDEDYMGPQGNSSHWRGVVYKHEVADGEYDPMFVSLNYLIRNYL